MDLYEAVYNRRIVRDFKDKIVPEETLKKIINAGLQAPTHDHLRNWEFVILKEKEDKEHALQFVRQGVEPTLEILKQTLVNGRQKINDELGNPIEVGIIVVWAVKDTAKAIFNVDNYESFLSAQSDCALRNIVRMYPYDVADDSSKQSLRGDSVEISEKLKREIQNSVVDAGIDIIEARITHLAYSTEIAAAMLQRQQANAIIDAKRAIVEGAVGMVEMALDKLEQNGKLVLDNNAKASMINNLLVVLCANKESQPVIRNDIV